MPMKKTIKKRGDKKVRTLIAVCGEVANVSLQTDFEISQGRVDSLMKKPKRSERENASLAKAEAELATTKEVCS